MIGAERERMADAGHPEKGWRRGEPVVPVGPVPGRAGVGLGPRGLQRRRRRLELRSRTTTPVPGPTAGTRTGWPGCRDVFNRLCLGLALWNGARPDPQGADVRADEQRGQPRRGRQGLLVVPRRAAERAPGCAGATTTRRRAFPYEDLIEENARPVQVRARVRAARHGRLRRRPLLDRRGPLREGGPDRHPDADHGPQRGRPRRPRSTSCRRSGSATTWSWDPTARQARLIAAADRARASWRRTTSSATTRSRSGPGRTASQPTLLFCENETNLARIVRTSRRPRPTPRTASTTTS